MAPNICNLEGFGKIQIFFKLVHRHIKSTRILKKSDFEALAQGGGGKWYEGGGGMVNLSLIVGK